MAVQMPTLEQLRAVAHLCGLSLDDSDLNSFRGLLTPYIQAYNLVGAMPDELPLIVATWSLGSGGVTAAGNMGPG